MNPRKQYSRFLFAALFLPGWLVSLSAQAAELGAKNMSGSAYFSWRLNSTADDNSRVIGYACLTRDTLAGMARTAYLYRYQIMVSPETGDRYFAPLQGVVIRPDGRRLLSKSAVPSLDILPEIPQGAWIQADMSVDDLGQACIDGGIAKGMQLLAKRHGKNIKPEGGNLSKSQSNRDAIAIGTRAVLVSQDSSSPINIREEATTSAAARHVGYAGDRVVILGSAIDQAGDRWYQVEFTVSKATGWVYGDFVMGLEN
jgi:hypothetical protein